MDEHHGVFNTYFRSRESDTVIYNYEGERGVLRHAYAFQCVRRDHRTCGCIRGRPVTYITLHSESIGVWPVYYRESDLWAVELASLLGEAWEVESPSYVLWSP